MGIVGKNPSLVLDDRLSVNRSGNWPADKDFGHDFGDNLVVPFNGPILGHGSVGEIVYFCACTAHSGKRITCLARVGGGAGGVNVLAEAFIGLFRTRHVGLACIIRDVASFLNELVGASVVTTVTTSSHFSSAVENELDRKIDFISSAETGNLDTIRKATQGAVGPTVS